MVFTTDHLDLVAGIFLRRRPHFHCFLRAEPFAKTADFTSGHTDSRLLSIVLLV